MKLQVTVYHKENKYKPMSTVLEVESMDYYNQHKTEVQKRALENIGHYRYLTPQEIIKRGYTLVKVREYDLEKIQAEDKRRHTVNLLKYIQRHREEEKNTKA